MSSFGGNISWENWDFGLCVHIVTVGALTNVATYMYYISQHTYIAVYSQLSICEQVLQFIYVAIADRNLKPYK